MTSTAFGRVLPLLVATLLVASGCPDVSDDDDDDATPSDDDTTGQVDPDDDSAATDDDSGADDDDTSPSDDHDGDGWTLFDGDCDDWNAEVHPGAEEVLCDGIDNDCDGTGALAAIAAVDGYEYTEFPAAIAAVPDGGILHICPGTHSEQIYVGTEERELTITSLSGDPADTILDGQDLHTGIYLGHDLSVTVSHLTIQNGQGEPWLNGGYAGGGIMSKSRRLVVEDCQFLDNSVDTDGGRGGAIASSESTVGAGAGTIHIEGCWFEGNTCDATTANAGGAIWTNHSYELTLSITDCTFIDNRARGTAGAVDADGNPIQLSIQDTLFSGNSAEESDAGAIRIRNYETVEIAGSTFTDNRSGYEGGAIDIGTTDYWTTSVTITASTFEGNEAGSESCGGAILLDTNEADHVSVCMESVDFLSNHSPYHCGAVGFGGRAPTTISMTDVLFDSNIADSVGGAVEMDIDGAVSFDIVDSTFIANEAPTIASAMNLVPSDDGYCDLVVTNSSFDGNISSSAAIWAYSDTWVTLDSSAMTNNVGGAVRLDDDGSSALYSIDSAWGVAGVDDNTPYDVGVQNGATFTGYESSETFTCTGALGCL